MDKKRHNLYRVLLLISLVPLVTCVIVISVFLYFMSADKAILIPTIAIAAILMFVSFAVVILLSRKICMPIAIVADNIESIGSGDLFDKAMPNSKIVETNQLIESSAKLQNELSRVLGDTKNISVNLLGMIADVTKLINDTSSNTTQISAAMKDLASGTMALAGNVQNLNLQVEYLGDCITDIDNRMDVLADSSDTMKVSNNDASTVLTGILSRVIVKSIRPSMPRRQIPSLTFVPLGPRRRDIMASCDIFTPAMAVSLTVTMRSPAIMPIFSEGPSGIGCTMNSVSSIMLNCTPMPSNEPVRVSLDFSFSFAERYDECGSSSSSMPFMASSTSLALSTSST